MAQLNSLVVTGNSKFINDVNANTINLSVNSVGINFRPTHSTYYTTTSYQTSGNEALVFASKNAVTSFMFVNGEDSVTNHGDTRWRSLTPGLQIKNNCVSIGQLIDTNVTPSYKLNVYGTSRFADKIYAEYKSNTYVNSLTASAINIPDNSTNGFGGWICGPTKTGRIAIATYQGADEKLYFGWGARGRTENSYEKVMTWEGSTGYLTANKFIGPLQGNADTATKATQDSDGNAINTTYLKLSGGTMTGDIIFNKTGATDLTQVQMRCGANDYGRIAAGGTSNAGWFEIATADDGNEPIYARQYSGVYSSIVRTATLLDASGNTSFPGKLTVSKAINELLTGTGTTAQDKGSGVSPRYFPAKWTFNKSTATPSDGDMITIKIPCAGHDYGVFLSLDNGTTYKPVGLKTQDNGRLTTHFGNGKIITLIYDSTAVVDQVFAAAGADARSNITGAWKVITSYLDGNSNTYDRNRFNATIMISSAVDCKNGNIIVGNNGTYTHLKQGTVFDITYPILYLAEDKAKNGTTTNTYDIIHFTSTTTQNTSWTAYKPVYIKGTLAGTIFTPVSTTPLTQTAPTSDDGYYYIFLGMATAATTIYLQERHPIFTFVGGKFQETSVNTGLRLSGAASATMTYASTNPQIGFSENGSQGVKIIYSDYDSYRAPYGLKVIGDGTAGAAWFEVEGSIFCNGGKYNSYFTATPTSGQVVITDGTAGGTKSSGYTIATSVPSGAVFTDTKNTAGSTDTSSKIFLIGATSQAANPQTYSDDQVYTTSGTLQTNITKATTIVNANSGGSGTAGGLALYSDANPEVYGVMFRTTANSGKHGYVQSDWATYFTMSNSDNRGWIFRRQGSANVASINTSGNAVFNGSVTVGGNSTNTSGARMEYNATNHCIDFIVT